MEYEEINDTIWYFVSGLGCDLRKNEEKEIIPNIHILHTKSLINDMHELGYCDFAEYQQVNTKLKGNYISNYLNNDSIKLINDFYEDDFRLFHYTKIIV